MKQISIAILCMVLAGSVFAEEDSTNRPAKWAQPVELDGVPNLHKVSDTLYRSAQPTEEGMKNLKEQGVETIINLRSFHSDRDEIGETELAYEHIYMKAWHPERKEAVRFLKIVTSKKGQPVLVHCLHGADRTGTMCAIYRIAVEGWTKEDAIKEMTDGGYNFHSIFDDLKEWIKELDIEKLKRDAGMETDEKTNIGKSVKSATPRPAEKSGEKK